MMRGLTPLRKANTLIIYFFMIGPPPYFLSFFYIFLFFIRRYLKNLTYIDLPFTLKNKNPMRRYVKNLTL